MTTQAPSPSSSVPDELRAAELTARLGLEPELAERYFHDPVSVLLQHGFDAGAEPVYADHTGVIEHLSGRASVRLDQAGTPVVAGGPDLMVSQTLGTWSRPAPAPSELSLETVPA
ncbi:hypothetical protein PJ985_18610 [Streptomyces sp. ACA25]|uniref:hypothetical protein n=1 Tax=Streptomyces sp. ACA25 TaxID=3022596 RepID=UPI002307173F|nr:hypothetical protein [Streptomyces sp. ACA25]MDB1089575.1 hypothetical protein [Streptomyces sp. ACA25]